MELAGAVEVEDGVEGARVAVEEVLVVEDGVVGAEVHDLVVRVGAAEEPQPRVRDLLQHPPHHLVSAQGALTIRNTKVELSTSLREVSQFPKMKSLFLFYSDTILIGHLNTVVSK